MASLRFKYILYSIISIMSKLNPALHAGVTNNVKFSRSVMLKHPEKVKVYFRILMNGQRNSMILRSIFFFTFLGVGSWLPFYNLYLHDLGFSKFQIGTISGIIQANMILVLPLWGYLADRYGRKRILMIALLVTVVMMNLFLYQGSYWFFLIFTFCFAFFSNPFGALTDNLALDYIQNHRSTYGEIRLWASVGWAVATTIVGRIVLNAGPAIIFPVASGVFFVTFLVTSQYNDLHQISEQQKSLKIRDVPRILQSKSLFFFLILMFLAAVCTAPIYMMINLYYQGIGATYEQIGIAFAVQAISELPFFFYGGKLLNRFGAAKLLLFAISIAIVRMLAYSMNYNPWIGVGIGVLQGITLGCFLVAAIDFIHHHVPKEWRGTGQSLFWTFYFGAGMMVGNIWTGFLLDNVTSQFTMQLEAGLTFIVLILLSVFFRWDRNRESRFGIRGS